MTAKSLPNKNSVEKRWTFLAYIAGDNNLSNAGLEDIQELCDEGASPDVYAGVEIDTYGEFSGSIRYEITEPDFSGEAHRTVIERLPEKDSGDPESLTSFLTWGLSRYPAQNQVVVIWNHGSGFRYRNRDIGFDDFGSSLDMPEVEMAFRRAGITAENKVTILGFDACLMNMLEIAHHLRDQAEFIVGSQETEPGDGWPYDKVLRTMKSATSGVELAKGIVQEYIKDYTDLGVQNVTQSAIDTSKTEAAVQAFSNLGLLLKDKVETCKSELRRLRAQLQAFEYADYVDLVHLVELLPQFINEPDVAQAAENVRLAALACVVASDKYGQAVQNANGLSIWFPPAPRIYFNYRAKYTALNFALNSPGWVSFLDAYFAN
ncbi:MAG: clostripain-related cysteine peptidase [Thainema sp.]